MTVADVTAKGDRDLPPEGGSHALLHPPIRQHGADAFGLAGAASEQILVAGGPLLEQAHVFQ